MCVIAIAEKKRLDAETIKKCHCANSDGIGIAWLNRELGRVEYKKNLTIDDAIQLAESLPLPYIYHFRLATVGGKEPILCHPFEIDKNSPLSLEGHSSSVLFHNGHWSNWQEVLTNAEIKLTGPISDSRAIAALVSEMGDKALHLITGKFAILSSKKIKKFGFWSNEDGIHFSNLFWKFRGLPTVYSYRSLADEGEAWAAYCA